MIGLLLFLTLGALVASDPQIIYREVDGPLLFQKYKVDYNKKYNSAEEEAKRFQIFKNNLKYINELNANTNIATFGITEYADLTKEEFTAAKTFPYNANTKRTKKIKSNYFCELVEAYTNDAPDSWDWREQGKVTPIKAQKFCGNTWGFATVGAIEGAFAIKNHELVVLSEQQLYDCDYDNGGCDEGDVETAMGYLVTKTYGLMTAKDYPQTLDVQTCKYNASKVKAKVVDCYKIDKHNLNQIKEFLFKYGPITAVIEAIGLFSYKSGILDEEHCPGGMDRVDVLLVGYGSENGTDYWILKNSWDVTFGEKGYFRVIRKSGTNPCSIYTKDMLQAVVI